MSEVMDEDHVPLVEPDEALKSRLQILSNHFVSKFNNKPDFIVRVPGRVNLIGDHIDYSGYSVCPMAIEQDVLVAAGKSDNAGLHLSNVDPMYLDYHCPNLIKCRDDLHKDEKLQWYKYFICGAARALEIIPSEQVGESLNVAVWGNIPPAAGLSSSSALVSSAVLTLTHAYNYPLPRKELAMISAEAERYIGTEGGAMDQAIAFLATAGAAKLIEFNPLRGTDVILPRQAVFVIANSMAQCNKAATENYNIRVERCRKAVQLIAKAKIEGEHDIKTLSELQQKLETNLSETLEIAEKVLSDEHPTLLKHCQHVLTEAQRVLDFQNIAKNKDCEQLSRLGDLMNQSHVSLRDFYECSHPLADELVEMALNSGALGARITGAGWGGCIVILTTKDKVHDFVNTLRQKIRESPNFSSGNYDLKTMVFPTEPRQGATLCLYQ